MMLEQAIEEMKKGIKDRTEVLQSHSPRGDQMKLLEAEVRRLRAIIVGCVAELHEQPTDTALVDKILVEMNNTKVKMSEVNSLDCMICGKPKGQPPDRCNGHHSGTPSDPALLP